LFFLILFCLPAGLAGADSKEDLERQIGQMLMVGFRGLEVDESSPIVRDIREGRVGGVILFDYDVALHSPVRNVASPAQVKKLVTDLQAVAPSLPLFVAIDQEGGRVNRLKERHGFPPTVSQGWLGEQNNPTLTAHYARQTARTLADLGINLNLSPVLDVNVNPKSPVIGRLGRSFSADPMVVAAHAQEVIIAHRGEGVLTALKHFPGHGSSTADSHLGFTDVTQTWSELELVPYREILRSSGADIIMTAHVYNAKLDPKWPATLSETTIQGLLREQMGFDGVVISDDMQMRAITDHYTLETALERTILAGVDVMIFGNNLVYDEQIASTAVNIILKLVQEGRVPAWRISESYNRIVYLKHRLAKARASGVQAP
jgi:beta-N-acetylhexosaminidase